MYGDILYVDRRPLLWRSTKIRQNPKSKKIDIVISRTTKYRHYGIDLGDGRVVHFVGESFWIRQDSQICIDTMDIFLKDGYLGIVNDIVPAFSREEVVERALSCVNTNFGGYTIVDNNCEHFVMWCATGQRISRQSYLLKYGYKIASFPKKRLVPISKKLISFASGFIGRL